MFYNNDIKYKMNLQVASGEFNLELSNMVILYIADEQNTDANRVILTYNNKEMVLSAIHNNSTELKNMVGLNSHTKKFLGCNDGDTILVQYFKSPKKMFNIKELTLKLSCNDTQLKKNIKLYDIPTITRDFRCGYSSTIVNNGQTFNYIANLYHSTKPLDYYTNADVYACNPKQVIKLEISDIELDNHPDNTEIKCGGICCGVITNLTKIQTIGDLCDKKTLNLDKITFDTLNVGGLSKQFDEIFTKVLITRMLPAQMYKNLGLKHIKGIMLYGPPGCGKGVLARSLSKIINCQSVKTVNGPELLSKWVGQSEENVRALFYESEQKPQDLHMIIFDEFDSLFTKRSDHHSDKHTNQLVNQLLTKVDGIAESNNIILIGITNRFELIDPAVLRPGRFEVHIKIDYPDYNGRIEIFKLHSKKLSQSGYLDEDVNFDELARLTDNFSGADIEAIIKNTVCAHIKEFTTIDNIELLDRKSTV